jgi:hypothetical protein
MMKTFLATLALATALVAAPAVASNDGSCHFDSDCRRGVKCNSGRCLTATGGSCNFDSDCGGEGAKCNSGKCSNAPDGSCHFDSECAGTGKCNSGKCKK